MRARPRSDDPLIADAEAAYQKAIAVARASGARTLELRAAASRFRLRQRLGEADSARNDLAAVLEGFTEGRETPYVADARRLVAGVDS